jgi:hypothetical protein
VVGVRPRSSAVPPVHVLFCLDLLKAFNSFPTWGKRESIEKEKSSDSEKGDKEMITPVQLGDTQSQPMNGALMKKEQEPFTGIQT